MDNERPGSREANKICGVCGDRALGYNFNAVSCESCKAFFRRNALKNKDFRCPFSENCTITPVTRRFCQKCRLDKCFTIGMRKEYIMTEEDKVLKKKKIEQNRAKKRSPPDQPRVSKMKRETIEVDPCNDDTSISVTSVASTTSETNLWDSDRKYDDLDVNRSTTMENMSPVTAASVPSPSSPPENRDIVGSKTLDMLKDSFNNGTTNLSKCSANLSKESSLCKKNSGRVIFFHNPTRSVGRSRHSKSYFASSRDNERSTSPSNSDNNEIHVSSVEQRNVKNHINTTEFMTKLIDNPDFVVQHISNNPHLIAKILQDKNILTKIIMDPHVMETLTNDPQIIEFYEKHKIEKMCHSNSPINNRDSGNMIRDMLEEKQSPAANPILTNLITSDKPMMNNDKTDDEYIDEFDKNSEDINRSILSVDERNSSTINSIESILCEAIKLEFSAYSTLGGNEKSRELNDAERAKLNELIVANKALLAPLDEDITNLVGEECRFKGNSNDQSDPMLLDVINLTAIAIRRMIKMAKKINAFKNMCQEDQLALLKGGCTEMLILRSAPAYDPDKDMWKIPHSQESMTKIKVNVLKEAKGNVYAEHAKFVRTFDPRWRDENIILILSAIALFTPDRPRVIHGDVIKLEQNSYFYLLRRYLESIYPGCEAKSMFLKLIQKISELHKVNSEVVEVYLNVNPSSVEPLLIEIFDLKL